MDHLIVEIEYKSLPPEFIRCERQADADRLVDRLVGRADVYRVLVFQPFRVAYRKIGT